MPVYFEYGLKVSLCIAAIFFFYSLLLKQITYYTWNRYFLLIFSILSFIVPFININVFVETQHLKNIASIDQIPLIGHNAITENLPTTQGEFSYSQILVALYVLVTSFLLFRLLVQLLSIRKIRSKARLLADGEVKLYQLSEPILPFSFFNSIFINKNNYDESELQEIIDHEQVHVQQKHSLDVLVSEVICIFNWFNPFVWLIKKAIRENLEFIADKAVLTKGVNKKDYQYLLLKVTGDVPSPVSCSFKFSSLKNRILMMNKTKTSRLHLLKFMLLFPMIFIILFAFRNKKEIVHNSSEVKSVTADVFTLNKLTYSIPNAKVKAIVFKEPDECLLIPGELFNLTILSNEKNRLKSLLERNGYKKLNSNDITFLIDSSSTDKSFSVQINIDVEGNVAYAEGRKSLLNKEALKPDGKYSLKTTVDVERNKLSVINNFLQLLNGHTYLNSSKTKPGC